MKRKRVTILKLKEKKWNRVGQVLFGKNQFLELPLKKRLMISYLDAYNFAS